MPSEHFPDVRPVTQRSSIPEALRRETQMNSRNFFGELKRRNVYKVAVVYPVVSWLLIQAASILVPTFKAPSWVMKVFVLVIVLGFSAALIFS
jgi:hypothetical protein